MYSVEEIEYHMKHFGIFKCIKDYRNNIKRDMHYGIVQITDNVRIGSVKTTIVYINDFMPVPLIDFCNHFEVKGRKEKIEDLLECIQEKK
jgi:hypothetical protein